MYCPQSGCDADSRGALSRQDGESRNLRSGWTAVSGLDSRLPHAGMTTSGVARATGRGSRWAGGRLSQDGFRLTPCGNDNLRRRVPTGRGSRWAGRRLSLAGFPLTPCGNDKLRRRAPTGRGSCWVGGRLSLAGFPLTPCRNDNFWRRAPPGAEAAGWADVCRWLDSRLPHAGMTISGVCAPRFSARCATLVA